MSYQQHGGGRKLPRYRQRPTVRLEFLRAAAIIPSAALLIVALSLLFTPIESSALPPPVPSLCGAPVRVFNQSWPPILPEDSPDARSWQDSRNSECTKRAVTRFVQAFVLILVTVFSLMLTKMSKASAVARLEARDE